jgi:hydroxybutyrate-dimer hydrolase
MTWPPDFVVGKIIVTDYLGTEVSSMERSEPGVIRRIAAPNDDLQSAGLSQAELGQPIYSGTFEDPRAPTGAEIRRLAVYSNYTALMETDPEGGYGLLFGPARNGKVLGREYLALAQPAPGDGVVTLLVQIPRNFDRQNPFIVTAPSSGSRGVYGAISIAEWGFCKGCAIAYTDKGTGPAFHNLDPDIVYNVEGHPFSASAMADEPLFRVPATADLEAFKETYPHRLGMKHAHSGRNVERNWGRYVLLSVQFALHCLNDYLKRTDGKLFDRTNTKIVAAGVSNGGAAALLAAEQDDRNSPLIDGVVVSEPQIQPAPGGDFEVDYRNVAFRGHSRSLLDTVTLMNLYAPSAAFILDSTDPSSAVQQIRAQRCSQLGALGLLRAKGVEAQAREALQIIHRHGLLEEADFLLPSHEAFGFWRMLASTYANAYARASVSDHLCGVSLAGVDRRGGPAAISPELSAQLCGWGTGLSFVSPAGRVDFIDDRVIPDFNLGAALCFRSLVTGVSYPNQSPIEAHWIDARRVANGIAEVRATGNLQGKPAIILHGRCDALIPPNHSSRAYFGLNQVLEGDKSQLSYMEIASGNHFDAFIRLLGKSALVPVHYYFEQALTLMHQHLSDPTKCPLPESQVVPATASHKPWTVETYGKDLPDIALTPAEQNRIRFRDRAVVIPIGGR